MIKHKFDTETYIKMGSPNLGDKIYVIQSGKKIWGIVSLLSFQGFKGARNGLVLIGLEPFINKK